ncbi:hypothetical protein D0T60_09820 [Bacteroides sp. 224]|nr:hypothetical protein [Bacteroides sp. 224]
MKIVLFENLFQTAKTCYKACVVAHEICTNRKTPYLCTVFFIVLDLRLTKVGIRRDPFFYIYTFPLLLHSTNHCFNCR